MSEGQEIVTREMTKAIVRDTINRLAVWSMIGISSVMLTGATWVGMIQSEVTNIKTSQPSEVGVKSNSVKLDMIITALEDIKKDVRENRNHKH